MTYILLDDGFVREYRNASLRKVGRFLHVQDVSFNLVLIPIKDLVEIVYEDRLIYQKKA